MQGGGEEPDGARQSEADSSTPAPAGSSEGTSPASTAARGTVEGLHEAIKAVYRQAFSVSAALPATLCQFTLCAPTPCIVTFCGSVLPFRLGKACRCHQENGIAVWLLPLFCITGMVTRQSADIYYESGSGDLQ